MNDEAAHLVDAVLPDVPVRQWVLSFPFNLRYLLACEQGLTNRALKIFIDELTSFQKWRAKLFGIKKSNSGAITFIQSFGSALNLNIHFHTVLPDGVFYQIDGSYDFYRLPEPTSDELRELANKKAFDEESLGTLQSYSILNRGVKRIGAKRIEVDPEGNEPYSVNVNGFSLNASVAVPAKDRKRLEKLIRYMARGPIATEHLSETTANQLVYKMKSQWRDGTTHVSFAPLDFIEDRGPPRLPEVFTDDFDQRDSTW